MSVLIKGMEMPKSCCQCPCSNVAGCEVTREVLTSNLMRTGRIKRCPLVPVPPHGRLIDADAVIDLVMQYCPDDDGVCSKAGADLRELLDEIENLPTIIPANEEDDDG